MMKFVKNAFWNDNDGFSAKDFLMVLFGGQFALFLLIIFFVPFFGLAVSAVSIEMIGSLSPVVMTIVGGVFAVQTVREFKTANTETSMTVPSNSQIESVNNVAEEVPEETVGGSTPKI
ncbi:hypothetical protein [Paenibacillus silvae]|uniref:hypothetical protein n=1 Tax=Paenibacillus silvae TaxID=1325358 RepID=UPI002003895F|nr:hypothetical protein [Paenibacillus silvae]MCK6076943.1 hypothetical protein [Paenibacillus silvae]MCK6152703.1 hypothetical protein [Paenibacillus silvae]MCK6269550.1 hypothetical protein [Paenibacillus silvae]